MINSGKKMILSVFFLDGMPNIFIFAAHSVRLHLVVQLNRKTGPVAQLNRAFDYGSKGFWFESRRGHKTGQSDNSLCPVLFWVSPNPSKLPNFFRTSQPSGKSL
jgi:hypothetical protein